MMNTVDRIKEAEDRRVWEDLNRDDPKAVKAVENLTEAIEALQLAQTLLGNASEAVRESPEAYRISSLCDDAEKLEISICMQIRRFY